jgi:hypothetical protein
LLATVLSVLVLDDTVTILLSVRHGQRLGHNGKGNTRGYSFIVKRIGRKCFNCMSIYGCKIKGGKTYDCITCTISNQCKVVCTGDTTGGACPSCMKVHELMKLFKKEGVNDKS